MRAHLDYRWIRWIPAGFGILYLILLATQFGAVLSATYLDADSASGPMIGQLFGSAGPHATTVLGTFGWYSTLLFYLATKWLPLHRQIWEATPYAMVLAAAALTSWSAWRIAGTWAATMTAVLMVCAAPHTLHLLLSTTEHGPDWFCLALLGAYLVWLERPEARVRPIVLGLVTLVVGVIIGVNAASDVLVLLAGILPFALAIVTCYFLRRSSATMRAGLAAIGMLIVVGITWKVTRSSMAGAHVTPELGLTNSLLATGDHVSSNFKLWWQSIAVLGNGDFFGRNLTFTSGLAVLCAIACVTAVALLPRIGWRELVIGGELAPTSSTHRLGFIVFWCASAIALSVAFVTNSNPVDIEGSRYIAGLVYAGAAVIPVVAVGRPVAERLVLAGVTVFSLAAAISMANGTDTHNADVTLTDGEINQVVRIAERNGLTVGYAGYWEAAPITWAADARVQVYPVLTCGGHLCPHYLHYISSWYQPRPGARSFLLTDPTLPFVPAPTPDLGPPAAVYHAGTITMYVYPYDLAGRLAH